MPADGDTGGAMTVDEVVRRTAEHPRVSIDRGTLEALLGAAEIVRDEDTCLAGRIRIAVVGDSVMVQEQTPEGVILVRRLDSRDAAQRFVDDRLATYERMWDGCGCTVDYDR